MLLKFAGNNFTTSSNSAALLKQGLFGSIFFFGGSGFGAGAGGGAGFAACACGAGAGVRALCTCGAEGCDDMKGTGAE